VKEKKVCVCAMHMRERVKENMYESCGITAGRQGL